MHVAPEAQFPSARRSWSTIGFYKETNATRKSSSIVKNRDGSSKAPSFWTNYLLYFHSIAFILRSIQTRMERAVTIGSLRVGVSSTPSQQDKNKPCGLFYK